MAGAVARRGERKVERDRQVRREAERRQQPQLQRPPARGAGAPRAARTLLFEVEALARRAGRDEARE
eukprot:902014-Prymnesium_polylepis.1